MKIQNVLLLAILSLSYTSVFSQSPTELRDKYERETVYWNGNKLMKGDNKVKLKNFKLELLRYEDSRFTYQQYRKHDRQAWLWLGASVGGFIVAAAANDQTNSNIALGVSFGSLIPMIIHMSKGENKLNKSIWYYNRDVLLDPKR